MNSQYKIIFQYRFFMNILKKVFAIVLQFNPTRLQQKTLIDMDLK